MTEKMGFESDRRIRKVFRNQPITTTIGGKTYTYKSRTLEYPFAEYLQFMKEAGQIKDWWYEQTTFDFPQAYIKWVVDFDVRNNDDTFEYYECKGFMVKADVCRKLYALRDNRPEVQITMVFQDKKQMGRLTRKAAACCRRVCTLAEITRGTRR
jgi:hypothetical protein